MSWFQSIAEPVLAGITLAICLAVPRVWVQTIINRRDVERHARKFPGIFERLDRIDSNVQYLRGRADGNDG